MAAEKKKLTHPSYFLTFLIAQLVKNLPTIQETLVQFLGWEEPLEKGKAFNQVYFNLNCTEKEYMVM